jgi:AraC-like DNA-binding protein/mannose-6-phosphate isomerase-like protein (cupin superfamily)
MSINRQQLHRDQHGDDKDGSRPVIAVAHDRPEAFEVPPHQHFRAQLVYATEGVMQVRTEKATWIVPPQQAVWVPPAVTHSVINESSVAFRSLYLHPDITGTLPNECCVVNIPALLRELILYVTNLSALPPLPLQTRLMTVIPDLLSTLKPEPLQLPLPSDRRLQVITDALMENPADKRSLRDWTKTVGASERTLERHFHQELGMNFSKWRQHLRLLSALTLLSEGMPVTTVAYELGYASPSAFIAMFRRKFGHPPRRYLQARKMELST